jgi:hypothetical protein
MAQMRMLLLLSCVVLTFTAAAAFAPWSMRAEPDRPGLGTVPVRPTALRFLPRHARPVVLGPTECTADATVAGVRRARRRVQRSVVCSLTTVVHAGVLRAKRLRAGVSANTPPDSQCNR